MGTISLEDSNVSWNSANDGGGILNNGEMMVSGGYISNNNAANGGGIWNMGTMDLNGALVTKTRQQGMVGAFTMLAQPWLRTGLYQEMPRAMEAVFLTMLQRR